jgi:hypothetical protein
MEVDLTMGAEMWDVTSADVRRIDTVLVEANIGGLRETKASLECSNVSAEGSGP